MATVHIGRLQGPVGFSRTVAIKRLHPQFAKDPDFVAMFLDEARLASRISHPNVVSTLDVVAAGDDLLLVMEYVPGESLARLLRTARERRERMPLPVVGSVMCSLLDGLHAAHEATTPHGEPLGIVHRDVSPQNVIVGSDGLSRVLDFGVAKAAGRLQTTRDGQLKGKLAYMAPEQLAGEEVTRRTDVYAAAVVLWEVLVGKRLFTGDNEGVVVARVLAGNVDPPGARVPVPPEVDAVVMRGLHKDPNERYATAHEMSVALETTLGVASPRTVAEWVQSLAGPSLARRAQLVADVEGVAAPSAAEQGDAQAGGWYASLPPAAPRSPVDPEASTLDLAPRGAPGAQKVEQTLPMPTRIYVGPPVPSGPASYADIPPELAPAAPAPATYVEPAPPRPPAPSVTGAALAVSRVTDGDALVPARKSWRALAAAVAIACVAVVAFLQSRPGTSPATQASLAAPQPAASTKAAEATAERNVAVPARAEPLVAASSASSAPSAAVAASSPSETAPRADLPVGNAGPASSGSRVVRGAKPNCSPPFIVDGAGVRRFKPACL